MSLLISPSFKAPGISTHVAGLPLLWDGALKFAFDVFELIGELSKDNLKTTAIPRPNFHPRCPLLMTPEIRRLFQEQWDISIDLKLLYLLMNAPRLHDRDSFMTVLKDLLMQYKEHGFSKRHFVELTFVITYWTLLLRQRNEWVGAPDLAVDLITTLTRDILNRGGLERCREWPDTIKVQGITVDLFWEDD